MTWLRVTGALALIAGAARAGVVAPDLSVPLARPGAAPIPVIAYLTDAAPTQTTPIGPAIAARKARAHATQGPLLSSLALNGATRVRPLWAVNAVAFEAPASLVRAIAQRPDVRVVEGDPLIANPIPAWEGDENAPAPFLLATGTPAWNIHKIGADSVWASGNHGEGVRVGVMDTGVDANHPALLGKLAANGWYDAVSGNTIPYDDNGHGTHVTGIIVGGNIGSTAIGVAPGATYLAAKALNAANAFQFSWVVAAGQWLLDPNGDGNTVDAPDIINCSWAFSSRTASDYHAILGLWRAAGILPVFAIGNQGPNPGSAGSPGSDPLVFGVGATSALDIAADFSGRGPAPPGSPFNGVLKPDVTAPGVNVTSAKAGGSSVIMSGTSMAAPHVSGALALLRHQFPGISFAAAYSRLTASAVDLGDAGPDQTYGYGRINVYAAIQLPGPPGDANNDGVVTPADAVLALRLAGGLVMDKAAATRADIAAPTGRVDVRDVVTILRVYNGT